MRTFIACSAAIALASIGVYAQTLQVTGTVESHLAAAKKAAGTRWTSPGHPGCAKSVPATPGGRRL